MSDLRDCQLKGALVKARQNWGVCVGKGRWGEEKEEKWEGKFFRRGGKQACPHPDCRAEACNLLLKIVANIQVKRKKIVQISECAIIIKGHLVDLSKNAASLPTL